MAKYIFKLRRGWKDTTSGRNDWATYESKSDHVKPAEGELVLEYDNGIPRLKIGDGVHEFSELPYMSVDSFILPTPAMVHLTTDWIQDADNRYYQIVKVQNATITPNSKVDLQVSPEDLTVFHEKDLAFVAENDGGEVRVYCVGQVPQNEYDIQCTITEVVSGADGYIGDDSDSGSEDDGDANGNVGDVGDDNTDTNINLITFTVDGTTYQAENGMRWEEWINSDYSDDDFMDGGAPIYFEGVFLFYEDGCTSDLAFTNSMVRSDHAIVANHNYYSMVGTFN